MQENRPRSTPHLLHDKLLPRASPNNKSYLFNVNSCPRNHLQALDASEPAKITEKKKKTARAEEASKEAPSSSQAKFQSDQWLEMESSSSGLIFADVLRKKRAKVEHLIPLIQKADRVIPESHAEDAEKIPLSTTWDIALANLLRVRTFNMICYFKLFISNIVELLSSFLVHRFLILDPCLLAINKLLSQFIFYQ